MEEEAKCSNKKHYNNNNRKPPSVYEINELYNALQDLVQSSPSVERRKIRPVTSDVDSSSAPSGANSPDLRYRGIHLNRSMTVRSASNIITRSSGSETSREWNSKMSTPDLRLEHLNRKSKEVYKQSPKLILKKSKSDVSRPRSRTLIEPSMVGTKTREERTRVPNATSVTGIDELLEMAKLPKQGRRKKKKSKGLRKRFSSLLNTEKPVGPECVDFSLRSLEVSSRLTEWYEKARTEALQAQDEDSYGSSFGSESDNEVDGTRKMRSLTGDLETLKAGMLEKWIGHKWLMADEMGWSGSDTSYEPASADETYPTSAILKDSSEDREVIQACESNAMNAHQQTHIMVSQAGIDASNSDVYDKSAEDAEHPNQSAFYIPNLTVERKPSPPVNRAKLPKSPKDMSLPLAKGRPKSCSALGICGVMSNNCCDMNLVKKSDSLVLRRRSADSEMSGEMKERQLRPASEYSDSTQPRSLDLGLEKMQNDEEIITTRIDQRKDSSARESQAAGDYQQRQKQGKRKKFPKSSFFSGKLKSLLTGKKT